MSQTHKPAAFDAVAVGYDVDFSNTILGRILRRRVWHHLKQHFRSGEHILELACGTGEDAMWLAQRGVRVTATDGSGEMIAIVRTKAMQQGMTDRVDAQKASLQEFMSRKELFIGQLFDGAFTNFGGINTIQNWSILAERLANCIKPGGRIVLVPMGPFCPWEIVWYLAHGQPQKAFRRLGRSTTAEVGTETIPIWYPTIERLRRDFAPWFKNIQAESLGLWLPPSYLGHFLARWPNLAVALSGLEGASASFFPTIGDHYILVLERSING